MRAFSRHSAAFALIQRKLTGAVHAALIYAASRCVHATSHSINVAADGDAETVVDNLPSAEVDAGFIDIVDRNDVAQKEHGLLIEVYDQAAPLQQLRDFWFISTVGRGERSVTEQRDHLRLVLGSSRVTS